MGKRVEGLIVTNNEEARNYARKVLTEVVEYLTYVRECVSNTKELENLGKNLSNLKTTMETLDMETTKITQITKTTLGNFLRLLDSYAEEQEKNIYFE